MTQAFSLYGELTVRENLVLDARLFHIPPDKAKTRIEELVERFGVGPHLDALSDSLPMGVKQRLSLAVAVLHDPMLLILDEPTSGVDPVARDSFWELLADLSRKQGVTIFVTTHFMNEGMRCDRISLMNAGKVLACDVPQKLIDGRGAKNLEEAFIGYMEDSIAQESKSSTQAKVASGAPAATASTAAPTHEKGGLPLPLRRLLAYAHNEAIQIMRDPVRLTFAFLGSALLMLVCGFGITTDVEHIKVTSLDRDQSQDSQTYIEQFRSIPRYFKWQSPTFSDEDALKRLQADEVATVIEIPPNFSRDLRRGNTPDVLAQIDGANPFRAETIRGYIEGVQRALLADPGNWLYQKPSKYTTNFQDRYIHPDSSGPDDGQHRAREGARLDHQLLCDADGTARISARQTTAVSRDRHAQLLHPRDACLDRVRCPNQGQLPVSDAVHAGVHRCHNWNRNGDFHIHKHPSSGRIRHSDSHDSAINPVLGNAAAGIDTGGQCAHRGQDLAHDVLHAREPGRLHKGPRARSHAERHSLSPLLHPCAPAREHDRVAEAGEVAWTRLLTSSGSRARSSAAS
jgi:ABC-type multidrug transport system ATPase subunit